MAPRKPEMQTPEQLAAEPARRDAGDAEGIGMAGREPMARQATVIAAMLVLAAICVAALFAHGFGQRHAARPLLDWQDTATVARGQDIYASDCAVCHGELSAGPVSPSEDSPASSAPPHDASGHTWEHPDFALFQLTKSGEVAALCRDIGDSDMPQFDEALSDEQILDVLSYIKSTWPADIRAEQDAVNALYKAQNEAVRMLLGPQKP
ncbi:c-type cytochrome [Pseudooceanicola sp. LIPI14-2-Ac024]|uniref:c-type cytochrome n=1 Tax=Pseudooceanicola sp. LIPI14-2-Ac024 TaxID=3344875 RepID=UPI0035D104BF